MIAPSNLPKARFSDDKEHIVTKENNHITIVCNDFDNSPQLAAYYLDMRQAFVQYEAGIFGDFDEVGVPMVGWGKKASYSAVNIAQYGFILHQFWLENKNTEFLDVMIACYKKLNELESLEINGIFFSMIEISIEII